MFSGRDRAASVMTLGATSAGPYSLKDFLPGQPQPVQQTGTCNANFLDLDRVYFTSNMNGPAQIHVDNVLVKRSVIGDDVPPEAAITLDGDRVTSSGSVAFSVDFSEKVGASFNASQVTLTGSLSSNASFRIVGNDPYFTVIATRPTPHPADRPRSSGGCSSRGPGGG
jgi:hypothetical protein